jgi:hypothetical protein
MQRLPRGTSDILNSIGWNLAGLGVLQSGDAYPLLVVTAYIEFGDPCGDPCRGVVPIIILGS